MGEMIREITSLLLSYIFGLFMCKYFNVILNIRTTYQDSSRVMSFQLLFFVPITILSFLKVCFCLQKYLSVYFFVSFYSCHVIYTKTHQRALKRSLAKFQNHTTLVITLRFDCLSESTFLINTSNLNAFPFIY